MLSLVLPKGSLEKATLDLFDAADLAVRRGSDRDYHASIDHPGIDRVRFLRPQEIPEYVEQGLFDLGITGRDWITETDSDVVSLGELQYSKATSDPVRVVLAVPKDAPWQTAARPAGGDPDLHRVPDADPALPRRARGQGRRRPLVRGDRGQGARHRRRDRRPHRDRLVAAQERAADPGHAAHLVHGAGGQPGARTTTRPSGP